MEGTEFPKELTFRGLTVHLPLSILAAIPGTWRAEGMGVVLGHEAVPCMFENRKNVQNGQASIIGKTKFVTFFFNVTQSFMNST